ncbi:MAG: GIY-YIG nuclease family protein, partial [Desulfovibrionaceae bacterium]|nr:GIY-YIG nuclease family protein [Desulfovibrionaceae bacterium]
RVRRPVRLAASARAASRAEAQSVERRIKKLARPRKLAFLMSLAAPDGPAQANQPDTVHA